LKVAQLDTVLTMANRPNPLQTAQHLIYFHNNEAPAFVTARIVEAETAGDIEAAAQWQEVAVAVGRLLGDPRPQASMRRIARFRGVAPGRARSSRGC
jgi:hypothetical protein